MIRLFSVILFAFLLLSINSFSKTDGTTGIPLGGVGTGALKFNASTGAFSYNFNTPTRDGNYQTWSNAKFKIYSKRGDQIVYDNRLTAVVNNGRVDDDATFPLHKVNFGETNNVDVRMTLYMPFDQNSVDNMTHPAILCEFKLTNNGDTQVEVAPAFQIPTESSVDAVNGIGFISKSSTKEISVLADITDETGTISFGNDTGFESNGVYNNSLSGTANSVAAKVTLNANETKSVRFVLAWYRPDNTAHFYYSNLWSNAKEVANSALDKFDLFQQNCTTFNNSLKASNMPEWLVDQTLNSTATLVNNSVFFKDGRYCHSEGQWEPEGTMDQMWHARQIFTMINPELAWKELEWWARTQHVDNYTGQIHHDFGTYFEYVGWDDTEHEDYRAIDKWVDLNCGFILSVYETFNITANQEKLNYFWPFVKKAAQRILDQVQLYGSSRYPYTFENSESTYDAGGNSQAYNTGLSIVAYQMMTELAVIQGETEIVSTFQTAKEAAISGFESRWLDGGYPLGNFCESSMVSLWIANYLKIQPFWEKEKLNKLFINMLVYYDPLEKGLSYSGGTYSEWQPYLVSHLGGYALQTNRPDVWYALQKDMYNRNYLNRNLVFNHELGIPPKVETPTYIATSTDGSDEYISIPVLWRNYYNIAGYQYNAYTKELWLEPKLFDGISELDSVTLITPNGYVTVNYKPSGEFGQNQQITFIPGQNMEVNSIFVSDKYISGENAISQVQIDGTAMEYERTGSGTLAHIKINYNNTITSEGITINVAGSGIAISGKVPNAPTGLASNSSSPNQVDLAWTASDEEVLGYIIDKNIDGVYQTLAILGADVTSYSEIGLQESTQHTYRLRSYNIYGISEASDELTVTTSSAEEGEIILAYNIGNNYTDEDGLEYVSMPSEYVSGGRMYSASSSDIAGTDDDPLYETELFGTYSISIPLENGKYNVILKMAEIYHNSANSRLFHVDVEGKRAVENLDIFAQVGKNVAYDVKIPVEIRDGKLNINLITVIDNAKINALAIEKLKGSGLEQIKSSYNQNQIEKIYPSPCNDYAYVEFQMLKPGTAEISIQDISGKSVDTLMSAFLRKGQQTQKIDVGEYPTGNYLLSLKVNNQTSTKQLVISK